MSAKRMRAAHAALEASALQLAHLARVALFMLALPVLAVAGMLVALAAFVVRSARPWRGRPPCPATPW